jgi:MtN3 and saliva related transmembrane protein
MTVMGTVAGLVGTMATLPQTIKMLRTGRGEDVSWLMVGMVMLATALWFCHAMIRHDSVLLFWNSVGLVTSGLMVFAKFKVSQSMLSPS